MQDVTAVLQAEAVQADRILTVSTAITEDAFVRLAEALIAANAAIAIMRRLPVDQVDELTLRRRDDAVDRYDEAIDAFGEVLV